MTSKEALETLVFGLTDNNYTKVDLGITMSKCREVITKELKILEFFKECILSNLNRNSKFCKKEFYGWLELDIDELIENEEYKDLKIKEWLNGKF